MGKESDATNPPAANVHHATLLVFGAWYRYFGQPVQLREVIAGQCNLLVEDSGGNVVSIDRTELEGPTSCPCPFCGEMQVFKSADGKQIDLAEHIRRCHCRPQSHTRGPEASDPDREAVFCVGDYVAEELEARGWTSADAVAGLDGEAAVNEAWLDLICCVPAWWKHEITFSADEAKRLEQIFGVSAQLWTNINDQFQRHRRSRI